MKKVKLIAGIFVMAVVISLTGIGSGAVQVEAKTKTTQTKSKAASKKKAVKKKKATKKKKAAKKKPAKKLSPEDKAVAIYEKALRAAGMRKPEEVFSAEDMAGSSPDAGMGWAISNIPIDDPQSVAAMDVSALQLWGYNMYYLKKLGSSNGYVRVKVYRGTHE